MQRPGLDKEIENTRIDRIATIVHSAYRVVLKTIVKDDSLDELHDRLGRYAPTVITLHKVHALDWIPLVDRCTALPDQFGLHVPEIFKQLKSAIGTVGKWPRLASFLETHHLAIVAKVFEQMTPNEIDIPPREYYRNRKPVGIGGRQAIFKRRIRGLRYALSYPKRLSSGWLGEVYRRRFLGQFYILHIVNSPLTTRRQGVRQDLPFVLQWRRGADPALAGQLLVPGDHLMALIDRHRCSHWTSRQELLILRSLVETHQFLRKNHIIHRDVKPANIWIPSIYIQKEMWDEVDVREWPPIVFDFDLAIALDETDQDGTIGFRMLHRLERNNTAFAGTNGFTHIEPSRRKNQDLSKRGADPYIHDYRRDLFGFGTVLAALKLQKVIYLLRERHWPDNQQQLIDEAIDEGDAPEYAKWIMRKTLRLELNEIDCDWDQLYHFLERQLHPRFSRWPILAWKEIGRRLSGIAARLRRKPASQNGDGVKARDSIDSVRARRL